MTALSPAYTDISTRFDVPTYVARVSDDWSTSPRRSRTIQRQQSSESTVQSLPTLADASAKVDAAETYPQIVDLFRVPEEVYFESGFESEFSKALARYIVAFGEDAVEAVAHLVLKGCVRRALIEEALRVFGRLEDAATKQYRRWLLEESLRSPDSYIRDAAGLGIADMDDPASIPALRNAIEVESSHALSNDLTMVLRQLESHGSTASQN